MGRLLGKGGFASVLSVTIRPTSTTTALSSGPQQQQQQQEEQPVASDQTSCCLAPEASQRSSRTTDTTLSHSFSTMATSCDSSGVLGTATKRGRNSTLSCTTASTSCPPLAVVSTRGNKDNEKDDNNKSDNNNKNYQPPLAMKKLHDKTLANEQTATLAFQDLQNEVRILSHLRPHPHIISLVGLSHDFWTHAETAFYLQEQMTESLDHTLSTWRTNSSSRKRVVPFGGSSSQKKCRWIQSHRIQHVALGVAKAMAFLHAQQVMFRDLKPANVGLRFDNHEGDDLDTRGSSSLRSSSIRSNSLLRSSFTASSSSSSSFPKQHRSFQRRSSTRTTTTTCTPSKVCLLDFGLARHVQRHDERCLTWNVGTLRYMAPEVAQGQDYFYPADVYSFGILLWEVCSLVKPYANPNQNRKRAQTTLELTSLVKHKHKTPAHSQNRIASPAI